MRLFSTRSNLSITAILCLLFIVLSLVLKSSFIEKFDSQFLQVVHNVSNPILTWAMISVSAFGDDLNSIFVFFALAFALLLGGYKKWSYFSFIIWIGPVISYLAKLIVGRDRPTEFLISGYSGPTDPSFPSGHVVFYTLFFGLVTIYAFTLPNIGRTGRVILLTISASLISLVGISRMYLGVHHPTDVIGGYLMGFALLSLINFAYFRFVFRKDVGEIESDLRRLKK